MNFHFDAGRTETHLALQEMRNNQLTRGQRNNVRKVGVILTDGKSNNRAQTFREAVRLRNDINDVTVLAVAIGNANENELRAIVSAPSNRNIFKAPTFYNFNQISNQLLDAICDSK